ncbi:hypothetical protein GCM10028895_48140 [Pontibacter rugosus]
MRKLLALLLPLGLVQSIALAQTKEVTTYHDDSFTAVKEVYNITPDSAIVGYYNRYYPTGEREAFIKFVEGKKDSIYTEFYSNGKPKLQVAYVMDVKQGPYKAFRPDGQLLQEGFYENDQQSKLFKTFYDDGTLKKLLSLLMVFRKGWCANTTHQVS